MEKMIWKYGEQLPFPKFGINLKVLLYGVMTDGSTDAQAMVLALK